jgi:hypothetical protein
VRGLAKPLSERIEGVVKPTSCGNRTQRAIYEPLSEAKDSVLLILTTTRALKFTYWVTKG